MDKILFDRITQQLLPEMGDPAARKALIESALYGSPLLTQLQWDSAARTFTARLVRQLHEYGEIEAGRPALVALLDEVKTQVGENRQKQIDALIHELSSLSQISTKGHKMAIEPGILIGFLLEVGRWAKSELSERWKVRREQQSADLTSRQEVEQTVPGMLQAAATGSSPQRVEETIKLIERKRDAIDRARNAKLTHREERERGEITENMFVLRTRKEDETIRQMMDEIESDLNDLGFDVERDPA